MNLRVLTGRHAVLLALPSLSDNIFVLLIQQGLRVTASVGLDGIQDWQLLDHEVLAYDGT